MPLLDFVQEGNPKCPTYYLLQSIRMIVPKQDVASPGIESPLLPPRLLGYIGAGRTKKDDDEGSEASCCEMRKGERMDEQYVICGQCAAWRHSDDLALGTCHRHAPTPLSQTKDRVRTAALVAIWPETTADAGCCEGIHASR